MDRRQLIVVAAGTLATRRALALSETDAAAGVRAALERGAVAAVGLLGKTDGFLGNPKVKIPLPESVQKIEGVMRGFGMGKQADEREAYFGRSSRRRILPTGVFGRSARNSTYLGRL